MSIRLRLNLMTVLPISSFSKRGDTTKGSAWTIALYFYSRCSCRHPYFFVGCGSVDSCNIAPDRFRELPIPVITSTRGTYTGRGVRVVVFELHRPGIMKRKGVTSITAGAWVIQLGRHRPGNFAKSKFKMCEFAFTIQ